MAEDPTLDVLIARVIGYSVAQFLGPGIDEDALLEVAIEAVVDVVWLR